MVRTFKLIGALYSLLPAALSAQSDSLPAYQITVNGVVQNSDGVPLKGAEIISGKLRAVSGDSGAFSLQGVPGGDVILLVRRIGYQPGMLEFKSESTLKSISVLARLVPSAVTLGTIVVEGKTRDLDLYRKGFYHRQNLGSGVFFDAAQLARTPTLSRLMNGVSGVQIERGSAGIALPFARSGTNMTGPAYCLMNVILDDVFLPWAGEVGLDGIIAADQVAGMEVYSRANEIPGKMVGKIYPPSKAECGLVVLWSKRSN